jgi:hypothetical protein
MRKYTKSCILQWHIENHLLYPTYGGYLNAMHPDRAPNGGENTKADPTTLSHAEEDKTSQTQKHTAGVHPT